MRRPRTQKMNIWWDPQMGVNLKLEKVSGFEVGGWEVGY